MSNQTLKPWGFELLLETNERYTVKKLFMKEGKRCSLQRHHEKQETIYVLSGELNIYIGDSLDNITMKTYYPGDHITIAPNTIHRMEGKTDSFYLEASTSELLDVERLEDDFGRV